MAPGLVPSPRHLSAHRLLLASLTGSERRGNSVHGARPRAIASSPGIFFNDPLSDRTGASCFHDGKCNLCVSSYGCGLVCSSVYLYLPLRVYTLHIYFIILVYPSCRSSCQPLVSRVTSPCLELLRALWRPNPCLSFYFSICLCSTMPAPVPNGTLWLQTSPVLGLPLVERRPHYLIPGVWYGRDVSATPFPTHPLPQNGNFDEKDEKNDDKKSTAVRILVPRGPRGRSLLSPKHPLL